MMPKSQYLKLSPAAKRKVKARLSRMGVGAKRSSSRSMFGRVRGHGDYWRAGGASGFKKTSDVSRGIGSQLGRNIGSRFGFGDTGAKLGGFAHGLFKQLTGFGDYKLKKNSIAMGTDPPTFGKIGRGTVVRHREYLGDVVSAPTALAFQLQSFPINPGVSNTFPWLSNTACCYEQYVIRGMVFEFKSTSGDALTSNNTALGTVTMCTEYNTLNPDFTSKGQMENHEYCTAGKPSINILHPIECDLSQTPTNCLYTRTGDISTGDIRLYDMGKFQIATSGCQGTSVVLGELWVTYDVELLKAQVRTNGALGGPYQDHYYATGTVNNSNPLGTIRVKYPGSNCGTAIAGNTINIPVDPFNCKYMVMVLATGSAPSTLTNPYVATLGSNLVFVNGFQGLTTSTYFADPGSAASNRQFWIGEVLARSGGPGGVVNNITFGLLTTFPGTCTIDIFITYMPDDIQLDEKPLVVRPPGTLQLEKKSESKDDSDTEDDDEDIDYEALCKLLLKQSVKKKKLLEPESKELKSEDEDSDLDEETLNELRKLVPNPAPALPTPVSPTPVPLVSQSQEATFAMIKEHAKLFKKDSKK